jgi:hypothetical protein
MKRPRLYQSFLVALVPTLLLSLVQISRLTRLPAYQDSAVPHIPLASSRSSISQSRVETKNDSRIEVSLVVQDEAQLESNVVKQQQGGGRRLAVVSFVDSMDYYLWGIYSIHKQLKKVGMTPRIRHVALVASDMKSKHLSLIESWLGKENVWPVNKSILRKKVPKGNKLWGAVFSKLEFFNLTMFDKVIALDNDVLIRRNIEHWFDLPAPAATQERGSIEWNSGAMVIEPNEHLFNTLLDYLNKTKLWKPSLDDGVDPWNSGDGHQGFLSAFFTSDATPHNMFTMNYGCSVLSSDLEEKFENHYYWMYRNQAIETMHLTKHKPWKEKTESSKPATCAMLREWGESIKDAPLDKMPPLPNFLRKCPPLGVEDVVKEDVVE